MTFALLYASGRGREFSETLLAMSQDMHPKSLVVVPASTRHFCQTQQSTFNYLQLQDVKYCTSVLWPYKNDTVQRGHSSALPPDDFYKCVELLKCLTAWESQSSPLDGYGTRVWCFTPNLPGTSQRTLLWSPDLPVLGSRTNSSYSYYV